MGRHCTGGGTPPGPSPRAWRATSSSVLLNTAFIRVVREGEGTCRARSVEADAQCAGRPRCPPTPWARSCVRTGFARCALPRGRRPRCRTRKAPGQRISATTCSMIRVDQGRRHFTSEVPGTRLVGDITFLRTGEGWLYLATVIDLRSTCARGWSSVGPLPNTCARACAPRPRAPRPREWPGTTGTSPTTNSLAKWCSPLPRRSGSLAGSGVLDYLLTCCFRREVGLVDEGLVDGDDNFPRRNAFS